MWPSPLPFELVTSFLLLLHEYMYIHIVLTTTCSVHITLLVSIFPGLTVWHRTIDCSSLGRMTSPTSVFLSGYRSLCRVEALVQDFPVYQKHLCPTHICSEERKPEWANVYCWDGHHHVEDSSPRTMRNQQSHYPSRTGSRGLTKPCGGVPVSMTKWQCSQRLAAIALSSWMFIAWGCSLQRAGD